MSLLTYLSCQVEKGKLAISLELRAQFWASPALRPGPWFPLVAPEPLDHEARFLAPS
jgi:hypothetical protein